MGLIKMLTEKYPFEIHEAGQTGKWDHLVEAWQDIVLIHPMIDRTDTDIEYTTILGDKIAWRVYSGIVINGKLVK